MMRMLKSSARLVVLLAAAGAAAAVRADSAADIDGTRYMEHLQLLASDGLQGRGNGTPGLELAADYIAERFRLAKLTPGGDDNTWFQSFEIVTGVEVGTGNRLALSDGERETEFELGESYYPVSLSARSADGASPNAREGLPLVFAGYGISAPNLQYDEYAGVDVSGKAVVVFTHEPQERDRSSRFDGRAPTKHGSVAQKALVARQHGARMLLVVVDPSHEGDGGAYTGWIRDPQAEDYGLSVFRVGRDVLEKALTDRLDTTAVAADIDRDLQPRSRVLEGVSVLAAERFSTVRRTVRNVIGVLKGSHPRLTHEAIVVGAHYDHLGLGGRHSLASDATGQVHNGADDNASGTAALMEMARAAAAARRDFKRTVVFAAFAGEELGLLGSAHYADHPFVPLPRTIAMINLDMIGRPGGRILVSGLDTAPSLRDDVRAAGRGRTIEVRSTREGASIASSDDATFTARRVPALAFFSGFHTDYHRPTDDWDKIDKEGALEVTRIALALTERLARRTDRPAFVEPPVRPATEQTTAGAGGYGPYFGSVPDFVESVAGVRFADIEAGSPAAQAGIQRGDVLVKFDGKPVATLHDFTFALRDRRPGDVVRVVVLREGQEVTADVRLGVRE
jgi:hypothetical protein